MITKNINPFKFLTGKKIDPIIEIYFQLEKAMQAAVYAKQYGKNLDEFIDSARARITEKKLISFLDELKKIG